MRTTAEESQRFVNALFDVYLEGDAMGRPFFFPKPNVHMTEKFFKTEGHEEFLNKISPVRAEKGNTYFVFDRGNTAKISRVLPPDLQAGQERPRRRQDAVEDEVLGHAERHHQPAAHRLRGAPGRRQAVRAAATRGSRWWRRRTCRRRSSSPSCWAWARTDRWRC